MLRRALGGQGKPAEQERPDEQDKGSRAGQGSRVPGMGGTHGAAPSASSPVSGMVVTSSV